MGDRVGNKDSGRHTGRQRANTVGDKVGDKRVNTVGDKVRNKWGTK